MEKNPRTPEKKHPRKLLKKLGSLMLSLVALNGIVTGSGIAEPTEQEIIQTLKTIDAMPRSNFIVPELDKSQIVNESNPTFSSEITHPIDYAVSVTHPGFTEDGFVIAKEDALKSDVDFTDPWYKHIAKISTDPSYSQYWTNIQDLVANLDDKSHSCIFNLEATNLEDWSESELNEYFGWPIEPGIPKEVEPPDNCFVLSTELSSGQILGDLGSSKSQATPNQDPQLLYDFLKKNGVTTIYVSGEYVYDDTNPACLGMTVLQYLKAGFKVRGIHGAVYPSTPPRENINRSDTRDIIDAVYGDMVDITDITNNNEPDSSQEITKINITTGAFVGLKGHIIKD